MGVGYNWAIGYPKDPNVESGKEAFRIRPTDERVLASENELGVDRVSVYREATVGIAFGPRAVRFPDLADIAEVGLLVVTGVMTTLGRLDGPPPPTEAITGPDGSRRTE